MWRQELSALTGFEFGEQPRAQVCVYTNELRYIHVGLYIAESMTDARLYCVDSDVVVADVCIRRSQVNTEWGFFIQDRFPHTSCSR
jgi:hypothetical protein